MITIIYDDTIIDPLVTSITWSGDITQAYRKLDVTLKNTQDGRKQAITVELGKQLVLLSDNSEIFRGVIFTSSVNSSGEMTIGAYDEAVYLTKSIDSRKFTNMTAGAIIRQICGDFGIDIGNIADTGYVIPKLILRDKTLWDMATTALTETRKQTGRRFLIQSRNGKLNVIERGEKRVDVILDDTNNIIDASYSLSIEDIRNKIRVIGGDEAKAPIEVTVSDAALAEKFGVMQHLERADSKLTAAQLQQLAQKLLAEKATINDDASVNALGNVDVTAGSAVYVRDSLTQIIGAFYVATDSHTWSSGVHKMALKISGDEGLPRLEYEAPTESDAAKKKSKASADSTGYADALARL